MSGRHLCQHFSELYYPFGLGTVFDVSNIPAFREGGELSLYTGRDASVGLARLTRVESEISGDVSSLSEHEIEVLKQWSAVLG